MMRDDTYLRLPKDNALHRAMVLMIRAKINMLDEASDNHPKQTSFRLGVFPFGTSCIWIFPVRLFRDSCSSRDLASPLLAFVDESLCIFVCAPFDCSAFYADRELLNRAS